jgi:hypothetical protein
VGAGAPHLPVFGRCGIKDRVGAGALTCASSRKAATSASPHPLT